MKKFLATLKSAIATLTNKAIQHDTYVPGRGGYIGCLCDACAAKREA